MRSSNPKRERGAWRTSCAKEWRGSRQDTSHWNNPRIAALLREKAAPYEQLKAAQVEAKRMRADAAKAVLDARVVAHHHVAAQRDGGSVAHVRRARPAGGGGDGFVRRLASRPARGWQRRGARGRRAPGGGRAALRVVAPSLLAAPSGGRTYGRARRLWRRAGVVVGGEEAKEGRRQESLALSLRVNVLDCCPKPLQKSNGENQNRVRSSDRARLKVGH